MTTYASFPKLIGGRSIHPSRSRWPRGRQEVGSTGLQENGGNGAAGYAVLTAVNAGSELWIFVPSKANNP
jgi:hypothetical protein